MNNKKNNRKGFTIVELVIVIAVIAILATVLVPTFGTIIQKAEDSKLLQALKNEYTSYSIEAGADIDPDLIMEKGGKFYQFENGAVKHTKNKPTEIPAPTTGFYWDADTDKMMHFYVDADGTGTGTACQHCDAATNHTAAAETTK